MKYLKVFETEALQDEFMESGDYLQPHVSCLEDGSNVKFNKYSKEYYEMLNTPLTFEALYDQTSISFFQNPCAVTDEMPVLEIEISTDNGNTWITKQAVQYNSNGQVMAVTVSLDAGEKALVRGNNSAYGYESLSEDVVTSNCSFYSNNSCYVYGNIMSLIDGNDFSTHKGLSNYAFPFLFCDYNDNLNASWFLSHPDKKLLLPALDLGNWCYAYMFYSCTNLTTAPELPATTLIGGCYNGMFLDCRNLNYIKALFTTTPSSALTDDWVNGVASTGTFVKNADAQWDVIGNNGIPTGWTVVTENDGVPTGGTIETDSNLIPQ